MSEEDIEKGSRGLDDIGKALEATSVGIICLTPENLERPWILFEAGALSKALGDKTRVCPFLFGDLRPENVKPPLGMFQATKAVKDDTRKLVGTVNRVLGGPLGEEKLDTVFERMWPELESGLKEIPAAKAAAAPERSEREIVAELLELSRAAAANDDWLKEALVTLLRRTNRFVAAAGLDTQMELTAKEKRALEWLQKEQQAEQRHMHAPSLKRAGKRGDTGGERK